MDTATQILVIITSSVLVIFLILAIVTAVYIIKLVKNTRRVVAKAEDVLDTAEAAAESLRNVGGPLAALKLVRNIVEIVHKVQKGKK
jgi:hypothetical protein